MTLPVIFSSTNSMPSLATERAKAMFESAFSGFGSSTTYLKARKGDFLLTSGNSQTIIPNGSCNGVLLAIAPYNHCTYYAHEYVQGQEAQKPDLVWVQKDPNWYPAALPAEYRRKIQTGNGKSRWAFKQARRTVWALCKNDSQGNVTVDFNMPVVFDISSMSLYGDDDPRTYSYKWSGLRQFCLSKSSGNCLVSPQMFAMEINIDMGQQVPGVVVFKPCDNSGNVYWLSDEMVEKILEVGSSFQVQNLLKITEILGDSPNRQEVPSSTPTMQAAPAPAAGVVEERTTPPSARTESAEVSTPASATSSLLSRASALIASRQQAQAQAASPSGGGVRDDLLAQLNSLKI